MMRVQLEKRTLVSKPRKRSMKSEKQVPNACFLINKMSLENDQPIRLAKRNTKTVLLACPFQVYFVEKRQPAESPHPDAATPTEPLLFLSCSLSVVSLLVCVPSVGISVGPRSIQTLNSTRHGPIRELEAAADHVAA